MRVMITGGTGFVGYHCAKVLLKAGHQVCLLVRSEAKLRQLFGSQPPDFVVGDIVDGASVTRALEGCDGLIHSAAMVSTSASDAEQVYNTNVEGTRNVIGCGLEWGIASIIHVSSVTALYNPAARILDGNSPPGTARSAYGRSKVACEKYVRGLQDAGKNVMISYPATIIGPDSPTLTEPHAGIKLFLTRFVPNAPTGSQFVDVRDVADLHLRLLSSNTRGGRHTFGGHYLPWREMGPLLERLTGRKRLSVPASGKLLRALGRLADLVQNVVPLEVPMGYEAMQYATRWVQMDDSETERALDFSFRPLEESMADTIRWLYQSGHISAAAAGRLAIV